MDIEQLIIKEARRVAVEHGRSVTPYEMREILRDTRRYIGMGMDWRQATEAGTTLVLRLYGERPPWARD